MTLSPPAAPTPPRRPIDFAAWLPSRHAVWWVLGAFAAGLLMFAIVWKRSANDDFYRAGPAAPTAAAPHYAPLPAPLAAGSNEVSDVAAPPPANDSEERPRLLETTPPLPPTPPTHATAPAARTPVPAALSQPQPVSTPSPQYPSRALRRGESGTVLVRAEVGTDGVPTEVEVARSSGSRDLDRAAVDAVRRWRFRPALADGRPTRGEVQIPIAFKPN